MAGDINEYQEKLINHKCMLQWVGGIERHCMTRAATWVWDRVDMGYLVVRRVTIKKFANRKLEQEVLGRTNMHTFSIKMSLQ
jgi:hypothetical protein